MGRWQLRRQLGLGINESVPLVDSNNDGVISKEELRTALAKAGVSWASWKAWLAVWWVDRNRDGFIDGTEIQALTDYAHRHWNIRLVIQPAAAAA